jgi:hypothetical protein
MAAPFKIPSSFKYRLLSVNPMAISHEISSEIATALLASNERSPHELHDLREMLLEIHSTLEGLSDKRPEQPPETHADTPPLTKAFGSSG